MTKRAVIITSSILLSLIMIITILFGVVFRVRDIDVVTSEDFKYKSQTAEILRDSKLRKNSSIFSVDRDEMASNIEKEWAYARARVNLSNFTSVKITLSNREPLYYLVQDAKYYILDEECKVLEITNNADLATQYILLNNVFEVTEKTSAGEFLSNKYSSVCEDLYDALYSSAVLNLEAEDGTFEDRHLSREDMIEVINSLKFTQVSELKGKVDKLIMITSYGTTISIIDPQQDMDLKVNMVFSALRTLIANDQLNSTDLSTKGEIAVRYTYDENNNYKPKCEYLSE